ncbi:MULTISPECIES: hypothetical protein [Methylomonas]|uniref:Uncharacterized protein n=1 Tax=Methylomonas koyamae TaxID=702114 RepID=A0A177NKA0_9GAMM|nr:hypothetical protein [Methylomonas koyamae]NJA08489.1 hypothetical protein [Methylococcaceae bacterium WWC4]OAI17994.1 hypothetical protein A1355_06630 [Methylomonas koyamae]
MAGQTVQQWTNQYNQLRQNYISVNNTIKIYSKGDSPALFEAQRLQLRLEYQINQHIDSAYTPELIDTYQAYQNPKIGIQTNIPIDGILYNNIGQPLIWDPNTHWGQFNQFREIRSFIRSVADFHLASCLLIERVTYLRSNIFLSGRVRKVHFIR